jgi:predicted RNA binding protein YcfA (HicA-like mRNA interferase family)
MAMKVRDVMGRLKADGWYVDRTRGDHRVLKHARKPGIVVLAGHPSDDIAIGTLKAIWQQAQLEDIG